MVPADEPVAKSQAFALPPAGACAPGGGLRGWPIGEDAPALPFKTGDVIPLERAEILRRYLPPAIWEQRDRFFYEGMRLEIGPCFRDYAPPAFFQEATQKFRGQTHLRDDGGLEGYTAGLPFAPETLSPEDPKVGLAWAWNVTERYQAGGLWAKFRVSDMVGRSGRAEPFEGQIFLALLGHRADRPSQGYKGPAAGSKEWVAGGQMFEPFAAREYAWLQFRDVANLGDADRSDDLHAYLPECRVRRINANQTQGRPSSCPHSASVSRRRRRSRAQAVRPVTAVRSAAPSEAEDRRAPSRPSAPASRVSCFGRSPLRLKPPIQDVLSPLERATPSIPSRRIASSVPGVSRSRAIAGTCGARSCSRDAPGKRRGATRRPAS